MSIVTEMYSEGYEDGKKAGKIEILEDIMEVVSEWKKTSSVFSCDSLVRLLESRKDRIKQEIKGDSDED